jgi:hypothetical protein
VPAQPAERKRRCGDRAARWYRRDAAQRQSARAPGRSDALLPVNHTSRPYTALNKSVEGVVRTVPRGGTPGAAPSITAANVPPIAAAPAADNLITMSGMTLHVPD